jgi:hypothetical protein
MMSYLKDQQDNSEELERLCKTIIEIFQRHQYVDRVTVPLFGFLDRMFCLGCFWSVLENPESTFASDVLHHVKLEIDKTHQLNKLMGGVDVLCHLIQVSGPLSCSDAFYPDL